MQCHWWLIPLNRNILTTRYFFFLTNCPLETSLPFFYLACYVDFVLAIPINLNYFNYIQYSFSSQPSSSLVSAMKGGREENGICLEMKLHVKWAPEVYDPPSTTMSHTVKSHQHRPKARRKDQQKHKHKGKSSRNKHTNKTNGGNKASTSYTRFYFYDLHQLLCCTVSFCKLSWQLLCSLDSLGQEEVMKSCYLTDATRLSSPFPVKKPNVVAISLETHSLKYNFQQPRSD